MKSPAILLLFTLLAMLGCKKHYSSMEWKKWKKDSVEYFPKETWMAYATPEEAGWSSKKMNDARNFFKKSSSSSLMVVYNGNVLANWGETDRRFMIHSIRKSLINGLYGLNNLNTKQS